MKRVSPRKAFRQMLRDPGIIVQPAIATPFAAKLAEAAGIKALALGGFAMGASTALTEPLLSLDEVANITRQITEVTDLPIMVDAGAGWGEAIHVQRTVRRLEQAGAASIHIEDQFLPEARELPCRHRGDHPGRGDGRQGLCRR